MRAIHRAASVTATSGTSGTPGPILGGPSAGAVILLAITASPAAAPAIVCAAELASSPNIALRVVHVVAPVAFRVGRLAPMRPVATVLTDPFDSPVLQRARRLAWRHGAAATLQLVAGDPAPAILAAATAARASLLILEDADHRRGSPTRRRIRRDAPCPTLTPADLHPPRHAPS